MIEEILVVFTHLIQDHRIITDRRDNQISEYKARLTFVDRSILEFTEINVFRTPKRKYAFQWMNSNHTLLIRWDNALHHPTIPTFPHHKHVGDENTIEPSDEMFLADVLQFIDTRLTAL